MKKYYFFPFAFILGAIAAIIVWVFMRLMGLSYDLIWVKLVEWSGFKFLPVIICAVGGLLIGLLEYKTNERLPHLEDVIEEISEKKRVNYKRIPVTTLRAFLPLAFGGSVGPEAGLTNIIAEICSWINDRFKIAKNQFDNFTEMSAAATLSTIFGAPLYGLILPFTNEERENATLVDEQKPRKSIKIALYITAVVGGMAVMMVLNYFFGGSEGLPRFEQSGWHPLDLLKMIPLCLVGIIAGWVYLAFGKVTKVASEFLDEQVIIRTVVCGIILGIVGVFVPYAMFSGEHQLGELIEAWGGMTGAFLIITGVAKLFVTPLCVNFGWIGGNIFPLIFAGVSIGYGISVLTGLDAMLCISVIAASLCTVVMEKPLIVVAILLLCFPVKGSLFLFAGAFLASAMPMPSFIGEKSRSKKKKPKNTLQKGSIDHE